MTWFRREREKRKRTGGKADPSDEWTRCTQCGEIVYRRELKRNLEVCPKCDHHFRIPARQRIRMILDEGSFEELDASLASSDPLKFRDTERYRDRLRAAQREIPSSEAVICGEGRVEGRGAYFAFFEMDFMGGSMGSVVGEKVTRLIERAVITRTPVIIFTASGGARMQEGILSLMQMAKVAGALGKLRAASVPYIAVLTDPTTGGVCASMGMLGDVILAEPGALIGFAGPRVIEETLKKPEPSGQFQRAEILFSNGLIDRVIHRRDLRPTLGRLLELLVPPPPTRTA